MTNRPRALAFDVFGTVVDWRGSVIRELTEFGEKFEAAMRSSGTG